MHFIAFFLFFFRLFKLHKDVAEHYNAEDIDPDAIPKSHKFIMLGMSELQFYFRLPEAFGEERRWRSALSSFKEQYEDVGVPLKDFEVSFLSFI